MIILMRHGADDDSRLGGWSDASLSQKGRDQVEKSCKLIDENNFNIKNIYSSDLPRARETAEIVSQRLQPHFYYQNKIIKQ